MSQCVFVRVCACDCGVMSQCGHSEFQTVSSALCERVCDIFTLSFCHSFSSAFFFSMCFAGAHLSSTLNVRRTEQLVSLLRYLSPVLQIYICTFIPCRAITGLVLKEQTRGRHGGGSLTSQPLMSRWRSLTWGLEVKPVRRALGTPSNHQRLVTIEVAHPKSSTCLYSSGAQATGQSGVFRATVYEVFGKWRQHFWKATGQRK